MYNFRKLHNKKGANKSGEQSSDDVTNSENDKTRVLERLVRTLIEPEKVEIRYEVMETIGSGGFGVVSKVRDLQSNLQLALKKLPFDGEGKSNASIQREIFNIIKMKPHGNIVRWHDIFRIDDKQLAIVMDLCNLDLATFLKSKENRIVDTLFDLALQITTGIAFLHTHDPLIIHRDIKPQNILIKIDPDTKTVVVKIADFGISNSGDFSQIIDDETKAAFADVVHVMKTTKGASGTLPFLAPEFFAAIDGQGLINGQFHIDASVDIFALGLVFAYMFCFNTNDYGEKLNYRLVTACDLG